MIELVIIWISFQVYNKYTIYLCISIIFNKFYKCLCILQYTIWYDTRRKKKKKTDLWYDSRFDNYDNSMKNLTRLFYWNKQWGISDDEEKKICFGLYISCWSIWIWML